MLIDVSDISESQVIPRAVSKILESWDINEPDFYTIKGKRPTLPYLN
jgi:hypothetical protein